MTGASPGLIRRAGCGALVIDAESGETRIELDGAG